MAKGNKEDLLFKAAGAAASAGIGLAAKYLPQFMNAVGSISEKVWKFITAW